MNNLITVGRTSFQRDRIAWVIRRGLSRTERLCKGALITSGFVFFLTLGYAKGVYLSLEAVLSLLPILVALGIRTTARLASAGDSEMAYNNRVLQPGTEFEGIASQLKPDFVEVVSQYGNYHYLFNPLEIQWLKPWYSINLKPLRVVWIFGLYSYIVHRGFQLPTWPGLAELKLFVYQPDTSLLLVLLSAGIAMLGLLSVAASYKEGIQIAAQGGVQERLFLYSGDRPRVIAAVEQGWARARAALAA